MKLTDLDAEFVRWEDRVVSSEELRARYGITGGSGGPTTFMPRVETLAEAQGVTFDCPVCKGAAGHSIQIAFEGRGVLPHHGTRGKEGEPTRWQVVGGTGLHDLSLMPSIDLTPWTPACWHGYITNGEIK